jgi:LPS sulfotransferase NodH
MTTTLVKLGRAQRRLGFRLASVAGHRDYRRFIVLTRARTGSNMLLSMLNSHPAIRAQGELFARVSRARADDVLRKALFSRVPRHVQAVGFKIFYYHPLGDQSSLIWDQLAILDGLLVIHLKRRNILRTLVSRKVAEQQGIWLAREDSPHRPVSERRVSFTVEELRERFAQARRWERDFAVRFAAQPVICVYYEDLVSRPREEFRRVTNLLDVSCSEPRVGTSRQNPETLVQLIRGYPILKEAFAATEWAEFFED